MLNEDYRDMLYGLLGDIEVDGLKIPFLSKEDLIKNKLSTGRKKDKLDAEYLSKNQDV